MANGLRHWVKQLSDQPLPVWRESRRRLLCLAANGDYNGGALSRELVHDPLLCAQLLRAANAGKTAGPVATLDQAAVMLGARALHELAERLPVLEERLPAPALATLRQLQRRDFHVAWLARELSRRYLDMRYDDAFFAGLLLNLGERALRVHSPGVLPGIRRVAEARGISPAEAATAVLGFEIATLSAALAHHWRMPVLLQAVLGANHQQQPRSELVGLADAILRGGPALLPAVEDARLRRVAEMLHEPVAAARTLTFRAAASAARWLCECLPEEGRPVVELFPQVPLDGNDPKSPAP